MIFSEKETSGMLLVNMADSKIPVPRLSLPPDSPLALRNSRHPITEAGFDTILGNLQKTIDENKAGDRSHGRITYMGLEQPGPLDHPCHKIVRVTSSGETWQVFLDPASKLPAMVQANGGTATCLNVTCSAPWHPTPPNWPPLMPSTLTGVGARPRACSTASPCATQTSGPDQPTTR